MVDVAVCNILNCFEIEIVRMILCLSKAHRQLYVGNKASLLFIWYEDERNALPVCGEVAFYVNEAQIILALPFYAVDVSVGTIGPIDKAVEA